MKGNAGCFEVLEQIPSPPALLATVLQFSPLFYPLPRLVASCIIHFVSNEQRRDTVPHVEIFCCALLSASIDVYSSVYTCFPLYLNGIDYCGDTLMINVQHLHNELGTRFRMNVQSLHTLKSEQVIEDWLNFGVCVERRD